MKTRLAIVAVAIATLGVTACGDDDSTTDTAASDQAAPAAAAPTPEQTVEAWFTAARLGEAADKCELETERYMTEQYGGPGDPCLEDAANTQPQPVWAEEIVIVDSQTSGEIATVTVQPNAGNDATATVGLTKVEGIWMIDSAV